MSARSLKRELGLFDVYALATGATLSSGFFLLPGLAAASGGGTIPLAYLVSGLCLIPGLFSMMELATAMPRAGGIYYFLDRSMGPLVGTVGGFGTWATLVLKSAFALVGLEAYLGLYFPDAPAGPIAVSFALTFGALNLFGVRKVGSFQLVLTVILLATLGWLIGLGVTELNPVAFSNLLSRDVGSFVATVGLVIVSYMGLTNVASISEEVRNPERNLPLGMVLSFVTVLTVYVMGTWVMVDVVGVDRLAADGGDMTPVATLAGALSGPTGTAVMTAAAVLAFSSVANAAILSASRYPLAMSRDHILPPVLGRVSRWGTPHIAIFLTVGLIVTAVTIFDPTHIAELAGAFALIMFALSCLAVVVMRESRIASYDPGFRSPFYPWLPILGIALPFPIILEMGWLATLLSGGFVTVGVIWYTYYARDRTPREGAIYHVFERLGQHRDLGLDRELREILKEKGLRAADPFEELITSSLVIDIGESVSFTSIVGRVSNALSEPVGLPAAELAKGFLSGTATGLTPVSHGVVLPHLRLSTIPEPAMVLVRAKRGVEIDVDGGISLPALGQPIQAAFFLASPETDSSRHLRILAQIAARVDDETFLEEWLEAEDEQEVKEVMLRDERMFVLDVRSGHPSDALTGNAICDLSLPESTLVAMIRRGTEFVVPHGNTRIEEGDRLTILGEPQGIIELRHRFPEH